MTTAELLFSLNFARLYAPAAFYILYSLPTDHVAGKATGSIILQVHILRERLTCVSFFSFLLFSREKALIFPTLGLVQPSQVNFMKG